MTSREKLKEEAMKVWEEHDMNDAFDFLITRTVEEVVGLIDASNDEVKGTVCWLHVESALDDLKAKLTSEITK